MMQDVGDSVTAPSESLQLAFGTVCRVTSLRRHIAVHLQATAEDVTSSVIMVTLYVIGQTIIFLPRDFYLSSSFFFSSLRRAAIINVIVVSLQQFTPACTRRIFQQNRAPAPRELVTNNFSP